MDIDELVLISADSHVDEPHDLWWDHLSGPDRELAPRGIRLGDAGSWSLVINGEPQGWNELEEQRIAALEPASRLAALDTDGVTGEVVYPTIGLYLWMLHDGRLGRRCCRIYNDWIGELMLKASPRIRVAGVVPTWDVDEAVEEVDRLAAAGFAAAMLPMVAAPDWNRPEWEPLWAALAASGMVAAMHQGSGHDMLFYRGWGAATVNLLATQSLAPRTAGLLACSGVFERHPELHVVLVEVNGGWLAWTMSTLDEYTVAHRSWVKPRLAEPPSHYLARQLHVTFQRDPVAVGNRSITGLAPLLWGNDYPHPESTWPDSRAVLRETLVGVDPGEAALIVGGQAARLFGFDPSVLGPSREP